VTFRVLCLACGFQSTVEINADGESTIPHVAECPSRLEVSGLEMRRGGGEYYLIDRRGERLLQVKRMPNPAAAVVGRLELGV
jgi:hypothetical protein